MFVLAKCWRDWIAKTKFGQKNEKLKIALINNQEPKNVRESGQETAALFISPDSLQYLLGKSSPIIV